jgi:hypothetical protein
VESLARVKMVEAQEAESIAFQSSSFRPARLTTLRRVRALSGYGKALLLVFILTLPLVNPWVHGDGVGYYAYIHSLLIDHNLDFRNEWKAANPGFITFRLDQNGEINPAFYTPTGHLENHFSVGPSMLWAPFLAPVHLTMLTLQRLGVDVKPDGLSRPYIATMALATALYGFLGLCFSYRLARAYTEERWAFLATLGIWFSSSLPAYMYFNPSWSHAHSVFAVGLFLWYWHRTRGERTLAQWVVLGLLSGLMLDVYYPNIAMLLAPLAESLQKYGRAWRAPGRDWTSIRRLFSANLLYGLVTMIAFLPTLITREVIYGHLLEFGYGGADVWHWKSPVLWKVLFSANHGLLTWTPIVIPAVLGLALFRRRDREMAAYLGIACLAFYYLIASHHNWDGISSFGNRFFISLAPVFVLGLSTSFSEAAKWFKSVRIASLALAAVTGLFMVWNLAFIFQWGTHLVPARGPISWKQMVSNQFTVVPQQLWGKTKVYFGNRGALMRQIDEQDVKQQRKDLGQ